ncbi:MAG: RluA family pseudouridine synthase [Lachnospiraceae bacterium]|jgi:23S rRNA pseudouridine955/2504/2580 synthase|nr:RluA family pseudouridine synthase [Lachnospiraceae bacterium]
MIEFVIQKQEAGRQLARFLEKIFPKAPRSLFFKALRSRKIKVNGKKPKELSMILQENDVVRLFFTNEQLSSFGYRERKEEEVPPSFPAVPVLYEDENLLILDKPAGLLSQKSKPQDISLTEIGRQMIVKQHGGAASYRPGVCNRLDRNTSGAVILAKNVESGQAIAQMLKEHTLQKFYWALVEGLPEKWQQRTQLIHTWRKDEKNNKAILCPYQEDQGEYQRIESYVKLLRQCGRYSLVEVQLLTGKSHQIRSQLAYEGHPIVGDGKYNQKANCFAPMLVAKRLVFADCPDHLQYMEGRVVEADLPASMKKYMEENGVFLQ